jgi:hypothetical protein
MYDDILGPVEEEIEINVKPKSKKSDDKGNDALKAKKGTTLKANLAPPQSAPTVAKNVVDKDEEEYCPECGCEVEECECEELDELDLDDLEEILEDDPDGDEKDHWNNVGKDCDENCDKCDNG